MEILTQIIDKAGLTNMDKRRRTALVNSISGVRQAFIGITGSEGKWNAGTFSNVTHVGAHPAQISVLFRPDHGGRHTYTNYKETGRLTLVSLPYSENERIHNCSANAPEGVFEWTALGGEVSQVEDWSHPIPNSALWAVELSFLEEFNLSNGCIYTVGSIERIGLGKVSNISEQGYLNFDQSPALALGLNSYFATREREDRPYPKSDSLGFTK